MLTETDLLTGDVTYRATSDAVETPYFGRAAGDVALACDPEGRARAMSITLRPTPAQLRAAANELAAIAPPELPAAAFASIPDASRAVLRFQLDASDQSALRGQVARTSEEAIALIQRAVGFEGWKVADLEVEA
jgi:hypothetical protein